MRLVFVCSGNICRSPYAHALARGRGMNAISCGTHTRAGLPADGMAIKEAARREVDLTSHITTRWEDIDLAEGDLIVAMQLRHAWTVLPRARAYRCPVVMLSSFLPKFAPVWDPYGKPGDAYQRTFDLIDTGVDSMTRWRELAARQMHGRA
jgi:protein-tyrosine phosphatase